MSRDSLAVRSKKQKAQLLIQQRQMDAAIDSFSMGQYPEAMKAFTKAQNAYVEAIKISDQINRQSFYEAISINRNWFVPDNVANWDRQRINDGVPVPVFIIGFPRSGTTLIEQILAAHSNVVVSDERPILVTLLNQIPGLLGIHAPYPDILNRLSNAHLTTLRKRYWELCEESVDSHTKNKTFNEMSPILPTLQPYVKIFGYDED